MTPMTTTVEERAWTRAAVTGGAGFVGRNLITRLLAEGLTVRSVDNREGEPRPGVETVAADLRDPEQAAAALADVDVVFHLAGNPSGTVSVENPRYDFDSNALVGLNVLEAVRGKPGTRLLYLSSAMVYGKPDTAPCREDDECRPFYPYGASKLAVEHYVAAYVAAYGVDASCARAFVVYGPGEDPSRAGAEPGQFLRWHLNGMPLRMVGSPDVKRRDFVHVDDLASGLVLAARRGTPGVVYNVGSGTDTSLRELVSVIETATGRPARTAVDDSDLTDSYPLVADISRLRALGYTPRVTLAEGIARLAEELGSTPAPPTLATVLSATSR
ncbi:NAD-dependent epimerase/dehydratase family protein [Streptomyces sp. NPDC020472]|uniref:NAD-dependent epimerase/dehydratase family protein n=1 Tax=Streptomyces sp. NPDC020472 TaxID=3365075 RepID=UPI0037AC551A